MKLFAPILAALALSAASLSASALTFGDRYGETAQVSPATRTIVVGRATQWVNVKQDEVVKFVAGEKEFTWAFEGLEQGFDLRKIAPAGAIDHYVRVYIEMDNGGS